MGVEPMDDQSYPTDPDGWPLCNYCEPLTYPANATCYSLTYDDCMYSMDCYVADDMNCWNDIMGVDTDVADPMPVEEEAVEPVVCTCFANEPMWESWCEGPELIDFAYGCVQDSDCHWGPMEVADCAIMNDVLDY